MSVILLLCATIASGQVDSAGRWELAREIVSRSNIADTEYPGWIASPHACVRKAALFRMMEEGDASFETMIQPCLKDSSWSVRRQAAHALERCGTGRSRVLLENVALSLDSPAVRSRAIYALGFLADTRSFDVFASLLVDPAWDVRGLAADQIRYFGRRDILPALETLAASDPTEYVKLRARGSIDHLSPPDRNDVNSSPAAPPPDQTITQRFLIAASTGILIVLITGMFIGTERSRRAASVLVLIVAIVVGGSVTSALLFRNDPSSSKKVAIRVEPALRSYWQDQYGITVEDILKYQVLFLRKEIGCDALTAIESCPIAPAYNAVRAQYNTDSSLRILLGSGEARIIYLTGSDLYQEPFHHTMGVGCPGAAIISAARLDPLWLEEGPGDSEDAVQFAERYGKLVLHEIGHLLGLGHCTRERCLMRSVETPEEFFRLDGVYCSTCTAKAAAQVRMTR